jgi:hypothetical protein
MEEIPQIEWHWRHIPGHQDKKKQPLDIWAERNILMDRRATMIYELVNKEDTPTPSFTAILPITINRMPIVCNFQDSIRKATVGKEILEYWKTKGRTVTSNPEDVAWLAFEKARESLANKRQHWLVKHVAGACSVGKVMLQRKEWTNAKCPRCSAPIETKEHVWVCQHHGANSLWEKAIEELRIWLAAQRTNSAVTEIICSRLLSWRSGNDLPPVECFLLGLAEAVRAQDELGWTAAFEGR